MQQLLTALEPTSTPLSFLEKKPNTWLYYLLPHVQSPNQGLVGEIENLIVPYFPLFGHHFEVKIGPT